MDCSGPMGAVANAERPTVVTREKDAARRAALPLVAEVASEPDREEARRADPDDP